MSGAPVRSRVSSSFGGRRGRDRPITTRQYAGWSANGLPALRKAFRAVGLQTVPDWVLAFNATSFLTKKQCVGHMLSTDSSAQGPASGCRFQLGSRRYEAEMRDDEGTWDLQQPRRSG